MLKDIYLVLIYYGRTDWCVLSARRDALAIPTEGADKERVFVFENAWLKAVYVPPPEIVFEAVYVNLDANTMWTSENCISHKRPLL